MLYSILNNFWAFPPNYQRNLCSNELKGKKNPIILSQERLTLDSLKRIWSLFFNVPFRKAKISLQCIFFYTELFNRTVCSKCSPIVLIAFFERIVFNGCTFFHCVNVAWCVLNQPHPTYWLPTLWQSQHNVALVSRILQNSGQEWQCGLYE
jgi:hypothetical protein